MRSGRTRAQFEEFDCRDGECGRERLSLHVNERGIYSAVWISVEHLAEAAKILRASGFTAVERKKAEGRRQKAEGPGMPIGLLSVATCREARQQYLCPPERSATTSQDLASEVLACRFFLHAEIINDPLKVRAYRW